MSLFDEVTQWLSDQFPGSHLSDGYFFLKVVRKAHANLKGGNTLQPLLDELTVGRAWIVVVGADPRPFTTPTASECETTYYNPDWNVNEWKEMWLVEVNGETFNLNGLSKVIEGPTLVALFIPDRGLVLHLDVLDLHATDQLEIEVLKVIHPDSFQE